MPSPANHAQLIAPDRERFGYIACITLALDFHSTADEAEPWVREDGSVASAAAMADARRWNASDFLARAGLRTLGA